MPRFHDLPLDRKLTAIVVATTMAGMLLASLAIVAFQILTFTTFMIAELETTAEILGHNGTAALRFEASRDAEKTLASLSAKPHITGACFFTSNEDNFAAICAPRRQTSTTLRSFKRVLYLTVGDR